jgi:hypothetical protein
VGVVVFEVAGVTSSPIDGHTINFQGSVAPGIDAVSATVTSANSTGILLAFTFDDIAFTTPTVPLVGACCTDAGSFWAFATSSKPSARGEYTGISSAGSHTVFFSPQEGGAQHPNYMTVATIFH